MELGNQRKGDKTELFDFVSSPENLKALGLHVETGCGSVGVGVGAGVGISGEVAKETNNNHLMVNMSNQYDDIWSNIDSSMLDELNCWNPDGGGGSGKPDNTDGAIYTLTVLNGAEQGPWFKHEEKEDKNLDIDSILSAIPSSFSNTFHTEETAFEDPTFVDKKEELSRVADILNNSTGFNNNNEWKQENNNEVDSLLRNALQGKTLSRYNGIKIEKVDKTEEEEKLLLESPILYDSSTIIDSDNPSSAHSMEEMFLSHLDVSYPDDYEKLKRIESEVAEVEQYCLDRTYLPSSSQVISPLLISQKPSKKYSKRSKSTASSPGSSSSSGVRKERSLHYCTICSKGFKDKYSVNVHIRTHTGEKPFNCSLCGKSFRQKAHLAKHYQTHMAQAKNGVASNQKSSKNLISSS